MCGLVRASHANTTLDFRPSDSCFMGRVCALPVMPKRPTAARVVSSVPPGNSRIMYSSGVSSWGSASVRCWW
jgi:hypothetical protein